ncbi:MAG: PAS domain S-box protein [Chloroflexi bacterium]|nr:PAS domain S-box protein [Chloroflexota bacterium]
MKAPDPQNRRIGRLRTWWEKLVAPPDSAREYQRARFLNILLVTMTGLILLNIGATFLSEIYDPVFYSYADLLSSLALLVVLSVAYRVNQNGRYTAAVYLVLATIVGAIFLLGIPYETIAQIYRLNYLVIPVVLGSILLSIHGVARLSAMIMAGIMALYAVVPDQEAYLFGPVSFVLIVSVLVTLARKFIQDIEMARLAELASSQEKLRQSEQMYRQLVELSPAPTFIHNARQIVFANIAGVELLGVSRAEMALGRPLADFVHPDDLAALRDQLDSALARRSGIRGSEQRIVRENDKELDVEMVCVPLDYGGEAAALMVYRNITSHKQQAAAERRQRVVAEALADTAAALNSSLDLDEVLDRILGFTALLIPHDAAQIALLQAGVAYEVRSRGYDRQTTETLPLFSIHTMPNMREMMETRQPVIIPNVPEAERLSPWVCSRLGAPICIADEVVGFIYLDSAQPDAFDHTCAEQLRSFAEQAGGAIQNALMYQTIQSYTDTLEQRVAERTAELSQAKERVEAILNSASDAILLVSAHGMVEQANPAFTNLFGYTLDSIFHQSFADLFDEEGARIVGQALGQVLSESRTVQCELQARCQDGRTFTADAVLSPVAASVRGHRLAVCSLRDITSRKQIELGLVKALERERELSELKSQFTTTVSHEFRTPLAIIQSSADLLKRYGDRLTDTRKAEHLTAIQSNVKHMADMLDDTLMIGKAQTVGLSFFPEQVNLHDLCQQAIDRFWKTFEAAQTIEFHSDECAPVDADPRLIRQMVNNLLSNAIKYSPPDSSIRFTLRCDETCARITVADSGIGIPLEEQERIFQMFYRATNTGHVSGVGLGLTIVQEVVRLHGGSIELESAPNVGTSITVKLPMTRI